MVIREYPKEIEELMKIYEPYANRIHDGKLENAPKKVIEAFEKARTVDILNAEASLKIEGNQMTQEEIEQLKKEGRF